VFSPDPFAAAVSVPLAAAVSVPFAAAVSVPFAAAISVSLATALYDAIKVSRRSTGKRSCVNFNWRDISYRNPNHLLAVG
jgi:hypothetical protein